MLTRTFRKDFYAVLVRRGERDSESRVTPSPKFPVGGLPTGNDTASRGEFTLK